MPLGTVPFDAARYFTNEYDQAELLIDALKTGEAGYIAAALGTIARARVTTPDDTDDTPPRRTRYRR